MTWHLGRDFIGASLALATYLLAAPALAQTSNAWEQCAGKHAATVDKQLEGCALAIQSSGEAPVRLVQTLMARAIACLRTDCGRQPAVRTAGCTPDFAAIRVAVTGLCRPHTITPKKNLSAPGSDRHRAPFVIGRVASAVRRGRKPQSFSYLHLLQFAMMRLRLNQQPAECSKSVRVLPIRFRFKGA
jgi:hypothetical protein